VKSAKEAGLGERNVTNIACCCLYEREGVQRREPKKIASEEILKTAPYSALNEQRKVDQKNRTSGKR